MYIYYALYSFISYIWIAFFPHAKVRRVKTPFIPRIFLLRPFNRGSIATRFARSLESCMGKKREDKRRLLAQMRVKSTSEGMRVNAIKAMRVKNRAENRYREGSVVKVRRESDSDQFGAVGFFPTRERRCITRRTRVVGQVYEGSAYVNGRGMSSGDVLIAAECSPKSRTD